MVDLVYYLRSLLFFDIPLLYYYINLNSSIICGLSSGDIYLTFAISVSLSVVSDLFSGDFCLIVLAILLPIKSPIASAVFWTALFEAVLSASVADCLAWSKNVLTIFTV